jgi:hypothetical protein
MEIILGFIVKPVTCIPFWFLLNSLGCNYTSRVCIFDEKINILLTYFDVLELLYKIQLQKSTFQTLGNSG